MAGMLFARRGPRHLARPPGREFRFENGQAAVALAA